MNRYPVEDELRKYKSLEETDRDNIFIYKPEKGYEFEIHTSEFRTPDDIDRLLVEVYYTGDESNIGEDDFNRYCMMLFGSCDQLNYDLRQGVR